MKLQSRYIFITVLLNLFYCGLAYSLPNLDPIKFSLGTSASQISLNEEIEIEITASYLSLPSNVAFVFEGSNSFCLKLILPDGFVQTGGDFTDFTEAELSSVKPYKRYTLKGKFTKPSGDGFFQLLRSYKKADSQSTFIQVAKLSFQVDNGQMSPATHENSRISIVPAPGFIPYLSIDELRAGGADTARAVFITDNGKHGLFRYNSSSTAADDGAMVLVSSSRRYERVYDGTVNVNWFGVTGDGTTDQTAAIQAILNNAKYRKIHFPKSAVSYRLRTIKILSNSTLTFEEGTVVEGLGTLAANERMIVMYDVGNIVIKGYNVIFKDHRENYTSGQFRHIFSIEGTTNAVIEGMAANNSGGDGFYIGAGSIRKFSENIKLINVTADNNRRDGLSIISGKNIDIINPILTNSNGEGPGAGIDIEPNSAENFLEGIRIENPKTKTNTGPAIMISPGALANIDRFIDIVVSNHVDDGSAYGFQVRTVNGTLPGSIVVENGTWKNSRYSAFVARNWGFRACPVEVINPTVINTNTSGSTSPNLGAAFLVYRPADEAGDTNLGNIHFVRPKIIDTRSPQLTQSAYCFRDINGNNRIYNCSVIDPVKLSTTILTKHVIAHNTELIISDKYEVLSIDFGTLNRYVNLGYYMNLYHNLTSTAARTLFLDKMNPNFPEVIVEVRSPYIVKIQPYATDNILPIAPVNGKYIQSNVVGSRITLKKRTDNSWAVTDISGTWTVQP